MPNLIVRILTMALVVFPWVACGEQLPCRTNAGDSNRPRIGLVLGGGGARGIAHISVIKELERLHVPIDCIAGTSMGSLVGGLYASGMPIDDIETLVTTADWPTMFEDSLDRPDRSFRRKRDDVLSLVSVKPGIGKNGVKLASGLLAGEKIMLLFERLTGPVARVDDFDLLPIPYRAVATDINTGEAVVLAHGSLAEAMRASMSIPGVFRPIKIGDRILVDGGIANQVPVDVARAMGADIVIAVDVGTPLSALDDTASVLSLADQMSGFLTVGNTRRTLADLGPRDILVQPDFAEQVKTSAFDKAELALQIGRDAMAPLQPRLSALAQPSEMPGPERMASAPVRARAPPVIDFVRLDNQTRYSDAMLLARLDIPTGQLLDRDRLEARIQAVYGLDTLDTVTYDVIDEQGRTGLLVHLRPHTFGPNYLETGLNMYSDFQGEFQLSVRAGILRSPLNSLGGEARVLAQVGSEPGLYGEIYQPLDVRGRYYVGAKALYDSPTLSVFDDDGNRLANYQFPTLGIEGYVGREFGNYGALNLLLRRQHGHSERLVGLLALAEGDFDIGEAVWSLTLDRLDSAQIPRDGNYASLGQVFSRRDLGADSNFTQLNFDYIAAHAIGVHSAYYGLRYHETTSGIAPFQSQFRLGGVTRLPGYRPNELVTPNYALAFVGYTYELGRVLNRPAILGGTLEVADLWRELNGQSRHQHLNSASVYFGFDSWLGRLLFGYGTRQNGDGTFFLELGRTR